MSRYRRHPAHVTADRLKADYERYYDSLAGSERVAAEAVIQALEEIGDGGRVEGETP